MRAEEMMKLKILDSGSGITIGSVTGILIDDDKRQVLALEVGGGLLSRPEYLPMANIESIEYDVLAISSSEAIVDRGELTTSRLVGGSGGHRVLVADWQNLGVVRDWDIDTSNGEVTLTTPPIDAAGMDGPGRSAGARRGISAQCAGNR